MTKTASTESALPVSLSDIRQAAAVIAGAVKRAPFHPSLTLSRLAGCALFLKFENLQFTASFKERGALNKLLSLTLEERAHGVIAVSAGNHAQGVAYHAGRLGIRTTIVMPVGTPFNKVKHTRDLGAEVILEGTSLSEALATGAHIARKDGLTFLHPYDDPKVIAGQGTIALEMLEDVPELDTLVVPVGGGGLIAGIAVAAKALKPAMTIYGVETALYPSMHHHLTGRPDACGGQTIAEGIAVKDPGKIASRIVAELVDEILLAEEAAIESAVHSLAEIEKTVVEGAAAAGLAAILQNAKMFKGRKVGLVLSGGNIDMRLLSNVIVRELTREGRIQSLTIAIEDRPGFLAKIAAVISDAGGNILEVSHNRLITDMPAKSASLSITIEARDVTHAYEVRQRLARAGFQLMAGNVSGVRGL